MLVLMRMGMLITEAMTLTFHAFEVYDARFTANYERERGNIEGNV